MYRSHRDDFFSLTIREFAICVCFFIGVWVTAGVNPQAFPLDFVGQYVEELLREPSMQMLFWLLPMPVFVLAAAAALIYGGIIDIVAVGLAFAGGYMVGSPYGIILLVLGMIAAMVLPSCRS